VLCYVLSVFVDAKGQRQTSVKTRDNNKQPRRSSSNKSPFAVIEVSKEKTAATRTSYSYSSNTLLDWTLERFSCGSDQFCASAEETNLDQTYITSTSTRTRAPQGICWAANEDHLDYFLGDDISASTNSLYRRTMTTAALANTSEAAAATQQESSNPSNTNTNTNTNTTSPHNAAQQQFKKTAQLARGLADDASRAIGNLLPTASLQQITTRKYTLPDKTVASQVLMYRQLLHTSCRTGLKLSRPYQATPAQKAVMHMPWWEEGIEESKKMVISYDNLITRLWLNGAIEPFQNQPPQGQDNAAPDLLAGELPKSIETFITAEGLPPIPHTYWVERLGFQQPDPVTDFRSGGVLSLAMLVYMVRSSLSFQFRLDRSNARTLVCVSVCLDKQRLPLFLILLFLHLPLLRSVRSIILYYIIIG
jgi:hypothetical protein